MRPSCQVGIWQRFGGKLATFNTGQKPCALADIAPERFTVNPCHHTLGLNS
jgi:hypothetical protein